MVHRQNDIQLLESRLSKMDCNAGGQEASFEAIRRSLPPLNGQDLIKACPKDIYGTNQALNCLIQWRDNAAKVIVLATDEDSDMPME